MAARMAPGSSQDGDRDRSARRGSPRLALRLSIPKLTMPSRRPATDAEVSERAPARRLMQLRAGSSAPDAAEGATAPSTDEPAVDPPPSRRLPTMPSWRPAPYAAAVGGIVVAVAFLAVLTYYGAQTFTRRAAHTRAANEAQSFTALSGRLATGDAFDGYIQILRYADDPVLNDKNASAETRVGLMQQDLYLNVNKFSSLSIATRSGDVLASTDPSIRSVQADQAFVETRANLNPANSDIVITAPGQPGFIEYTTPLHEPDGSVWGILVARADPERLWGPTLAATIDGGRNVIINSDGLFAAGVPDELLGQRWQGSPLSNGGVRATIAGVDSICGLALIGKGTQIDKGMNVAACMPVSLIQTEQGRAMGKQGLVTIAGAVLASVLAAGALKLLWREPQTAPAMAGSAPDDALAGDFEALLVTEPAPARQDGDPEPAPEAEITAAEDEAASAPTPIPPPPVVADADALTLIDAYEGRNARLAERLRESIQARLLVAASQAEQAYKLAGTDVEAAEALHRRAIDELERIRTSELRALGQELHPALVRIGLPAALKALAKALASDLDVALDVDAAVDSLVTTPGRSMLPAQLRLALYRFAMEAVRGFAADGAASCGIELARREGMIVLTVSAAPDRDPQSAREGDLAASVLAIEAHGGMVSMSRGDATTVVSASITSPPVAEMPEGWVPPADLDEEETDDTADKPDEEGEAESPIRTFTTPAARRESDPGDRDDDSDAVEPARPNLRIVTLPPDAPAESTRAPSGHVPIDAIHLGNALEEMSMTPRSMSISLDLDLLDGGESLVAGLRATVFGLVEAIVAGLEAAGAARCTISVRQAVGEVMLSAISETDGTPFDARPLQPYEAEIEAFGGYLAVSCRDNAVSVTAEVTAVTLDGPAPESQPFAELLDGEGAPPVDETLAS